MHWKKSELYGFVGENDFHSFTTKIVRDSTDIFQNVYSFNIYCIQIIIIRSLFALFVFVANEMDLCEIENSNYAKTNCIKSVKWFVWWWIECILNSPINEYKHWNNNTKNANEKMKNKWELANQFNVIQIFIFPINMVFRSSVRLFFFLYYYYVHIRNGIVPWHMKILHGCKIQRKWNVKRSIYSKHTAADNNNSKPCLH